ncbi:hypothetical protein, partial [Streptomyces sp. NPDC058394]|uniref:hypothetical protein n=1 Tax=Streptomyces sp. NPDC058394 TaxID=3346477 RepID=UPI0036494B2F
YLHGGLELVLGDRDQVGVGGVGEDDGYRLAGLYAGRAALAGAGLGPPPENQGRRITVSWPGKPRPTAQT